MSANKNKNAVVRISFYAIWLIVSLLQAYYTELLADEAYYWKYAQDLAWGYFDHPPMVAVFIKAGYSLFQNELGVRLFFIIASMAMIYLLELLVEPRRPLYFYLTITSIAAFHLLSFLALPDMPLLFFSIIYLFLYQLYLNKNSILISTLLSITIALILLSKYHGILLIACTIIAYPAIVKRKSFWLIAIGSILLFTPHVHWQFTHDFPSIKYHLSERSSYEYNISFTINYILSTILVFAPIAGIVFAWHSIRTKPQNIFARTLYTLLVGTFVFFFFMSFKGRTEANWVVMSILPAFIIGYKKCENLQWFTKFVNYSFFTTLLIVSLARVFFVYDYLPDIQQLIIPKNKVHNTKEWVKIIERKAGNRPVIFMNKYQYPAWYEFYTGKPAISLNNRIGRKNQYNIWDDEYQIQGKEVMVMPNYKIEYADTIVTPKDTFQYYYLNNFRSSSSIDIQTLDNKFKVKPEEEITIRFCINYTDTNKWDIGNNPSLLPSIHIMLFKEHQFIEDIATSITRDNMIFGNSNFGNVLTFTAPKKEGNYTLFPDMCMGDFPPTINGNAVQLIVE